jgi:hypothetical protein
MAGCTSSRTAGAETTLNLMVARCGQVAGRPPASEGMRLRAFGQSLVATLTVILVVFKLASAGAESAVRKAGSLAVPNGAMMMVFCSDPLIQQVLSQDLQVAKRAAGTGTKAPLTLTVTVNQQALRPGVSLEQVAPGAPEVADLIKAAGETPPPLGDTGNQSDRAAIARQQAIDHLHPVDSPMQEIMNQFQAHGDLGPPVPCNEEANPQPGCLEPTPKPQPGTSGYTGDVQDYVQQADSGNPFHHVDEKAYDTVIVARASVTGSVDELTVVAIAHPEDDINDVKKLVGEEIANVVLH